MPILPANSENIQHASELLRNGEVVAFPTETVYGLGANALDAEAVAKIFATKGRPSYNPLIVHVLDEDAARELVTVWPQRAQLLTRHFWPGALTLVLPKRDIIPDIVTAGLGSVALRAPSHRVARQLLEVAQIPLAAPSANKFTQTSPTQAAHVAKSLGEEIYVLDGGACEVGIESTVLDLSGEVPLLLRPGTITQADIESVLNESIQIEYSNVESEQPRRAPGQIRKHYAPRAPLRIFRNEEERSLLLQEATSNHWLIGAIVWSPHALHKRCEVQVQIRIQNDALQYATQFYSALHELDTCGCDVIWVEDVPHDAKWHGVRDRLTRAAH